MAKKPSSAFVCTACGDNFTKWQGQCPTCNEWNCLKEFTESSPGRGVSLVKSSGIPQSLADFEKNQTAPPKAIPSGLADMDRVLGSGIVPGSVVLIGGDPGIGKSTLLLQLVSRWNRAGAKILYVSGEESIEQLSMRATRLGVGTSNVQVVSETCVDAILRFISEQKPDIVIVDSIQTMFSDSVESAPGSVSQVRECTAMLLRCAKQNGPAIVLIGHVTKDGAIAGPRLLEHMVDTVLYFEGDAHFVYRIVRAVKNRFGPAGEIALFTMTDKGLIEVSDPSQLFLHNRETPQPGTAIVPVMEGSRILTIELQALVNKSHFGLPQRVAQGINPKRLSLLLAVLERHGSAALGDHDIFFNIAGGLAISEPAIDAGIIAAVVSSFRNKPLAPGTGFIGETGLGGELRPVSKMAARLKELKRMGITRCIVPKVKSTTDWLKDNGGIELVVCVTIGDMLANIL